MSISESDISRLSLIVSEAWEDYINATLTSSSQPEIEKRYRTWNTALENLIRAIERFRGGNE